MSRKLEVLAVSVMIFSFTLSSHAQGREADSFKAEIDVARHNDSNIYTAATGEETSSSITRLSPYIAYQSANGLGLKYLGDYSTSSHNSNDNYEDHFFSLKADLKPSRKMVYKFKGEYEKGHDAVGSTLSGNATPDEWDQFGLSAQFHFGVEGAKGKLLMEADSHSKRYTTQTSFLDKDEQHAAATVQLRFWAKSTIFFQVEQTQIDYLTRNADNVLNRYSAGVKWNASGKTSGSISVGNASKDFSNDSVNQDQSDSNWSAKIHWIPINRSTITLSSDRVFQDTTGGSDDVIDRTSYAITWLHAWTIRVKSGVNFSRSNDDYIGLGGSNRSDSLTGYAVNINYDMGRNWVAGISFSSMKRDSNLNSFDYTRNISVVHLKVAL